MSESGSSRPSSDKSYYSTSESEDGEIDREPKRKRRRRNRGHGYKAESYHYYKKSRKYMPDDDEFVSSEFDDASPRPGKQADRKQADSRHQSSEEGEDDPPDDAEENEDVLDIKPPQAQHSKSRVSTAYKSSRSARDDHAGRSYGSSGDSRRKENPSGSRHHRHYESKVAKESDEEMRRDYRRREELTKSANKYYERDRDKGKSRSWAPADERESSSSLDRKRNKGYPHKGESHFPGREVTYANLNSISKETIKPQAKSPSGRSRTSSKYPSKSVPSVSSVVSASSSSKPTGILNAKKITSLIEVQEVEMSEEEFRSEQEDEEVVSEKLTDASGDQTGTERNQSDQYDEDEEQEMNKKSDGESETEKAEGAESADPGAGKDERAEESVLEEGENGMVKEREEVKEEEEVEEEQLPPYLPAIQGCRSVDEFHRLNRIEEGTYGVVYRAKDKRTGEIVALKRLKMEKEKEGFPITSLREINTLLKAQHVNIVTVREIVVGSIIDQIYIVMEYVEHDLKSLMETMKQPFLIGEVKTLMIQLLRAVAHLSNNWILHRDLKTSNLLLNHKGILKVGDFGLAREYGSPLKAYTPVVVTLWYRAPELLLQAKEYSTPIDIWSVGCIFGEFLTMKPLFPGKSEIDQLNIIFKDLGTPNEKIWPGYSELPMVKKVHFAEHIYNNLQKRLGQKLTNVGFDLINRFLTYCPERRITAEMALQHEFFKESPLPVDPSMFPTWPAKSELGANVHVRKAPSPKPPSGGKQFAKQLATDDDEKLISGFHMPLTNHGKSTKGGGFSLRF